MSFKRILTLAVFLAIFSTGSFAQEVELKESEKGVDFYFGGKKVLTYQTVKEPVPEGVKEAFSKSGFIHPISSPSGQVSVGFNQKTITITMAFGDLGLELPSVGKRWIFGIWGMKRAEWIFPIFFPRK